MKASLTCLLALALSGCVYQSVNSNDIETAQKICARNGSTIVSIEATAYGREFVMCSDRKSHLLTGGEV